MTNKQCVYLAIGRHGRYGYDTAIEREDMLKSFLVGNHLKNILPLCETVYHSPLPRAIETARFTALGLNCSHILQIEQLSEDAPKYEIQNFLNNLIKNSDNSINYYHFVTHLPVIEKLGLPFLSTGDVCILKAENWQEMLYENFTTNIIEFKNVSRETFLKFQHLSELINNMTTDEIYRYIADFKISF